MHPLVLNSLFIPIVLVHNLDQGFYFIVVAGCDVWGGGLSLLLSVTLTGSHIPSYTACLLALWCLVLFFLCGTNPHKMSLACHVQQSKSTKLLPHGLEKSIKSTTASMSIMPTKKKEGIAMNNYFNEWIQAKLNIYKSPLESQVVLFFVLVTNIPFLVYTVSVLAFLFFRGYSQVCCHLMNAIWRLKENTKCN